MKINNINDKTTTSVSDTSAFDRSNSNNEVALSLSIQELLTHLQQETLKLQMTLTTGSSSSDTSGSAETSSTQATSSTTASSSPYGDVSSWTVACVIAGLTGQSTELQNLLAKNELNLSQQQRDMITKKMDKAQDDFDKWMKDYQDKINAENHKSHWQKFCDAFKTAFHAIIKVIDKYDPIILLEDKIETAIENKLGLKPQHLFLLETQVNLVKEGLNDVNEGISKGLDIAAKFLGDHLAGAFGGDADKWEKAFEIILPIAAAVGSAILTAGASSALSAGAVAGEALEGVAAGTEVVDAGAQATSMTEKAFSVVKQVYSKLNLTRTQSAGLFMLTNRLQNNGFVQNLAKVCYPNDKAKQAQFEMGLNTALSMISVVAGYQCASSFLPKGELFSKNLYKLMQVAQGIETGFNAIGSIGVGKCDLDLSHLEEEIGTLNSAMTMNNTFMDMTEQSIQQLQTSTTSLMTSIGDNITTLNQAMPKEMAAGAAAL